MTLVLGGVGRVRSVFGAHNATNDAPCTAVTLVVTFCLEAASMHAMRALQERIALPAAFPNANIVTHGLTVAHFAITASPVLLDIRVKINAPRHAIDAVAAAAA